MRPFDAGQEAVGFFAIGQFATGFIAIGQVATGVIAIGQVARGVVAIGQASFGLFVSGGMVAGGVLQTYAMIGVGGRRGFGGVLQLIPTIGKPRVVPDAVPFATVESTGAGWVAVEPRRDDAGQPLLAAAGQTLPVKIDHRAAGTVMGVAERGGSRLFARIERLQGELVCTRLLVVPDPPYKSKKFPALAAVQLVFFFVLCVAWWVVVGGPVLDVLSRM
ncbi:MAG TPA: hypothetical protein VHB21_15300 [Minicystis sp.]|nr:hypothetical protein [Minicystis sp.]